MFKRAIDDFAWMVYFFIAVGLSAGFGVARICGVTHPSFQAFAHVFVGLLIGLALGRKQWAWGILAITLSVLELVVAVSTRLF